MKNSLVSILGAHLSHEEPGFRALLQTQECGQFPWIAALTQQNQWQWEVTGDRFHQRLSSMCTSGGSYKLTFGRGSSLVVHPCEYCRSKHGGIVVNRLCWRRASCSDRVGWSALVNRVLC